MSMVSRSAGRPFKLVTEKYLQSLRGTEVVLRQKALEATRRGAPATATGLKMHADTFKSLAIIGDLFKGVSAPGSYDLSYFINEVRKLTATKTFKELMGLVVR